MNTTYKKAFQQGQLLSTLSVTDRLGNLSDLEIDCLICIAIISQGLTIEGLAKLFGVSGIAIDQRELESFIERGLRQGLLLLDSPNNSSNFFSAQEEVRDHFIKNCQSTQLMNYRRGADRFYETWLVELASEMGFLPTKEESADIQKIYREFLLGPNGFIDNLSHRPELSDLHNFIIRVAAGWQEHLFQLEEYQEAAHVTNAICFSLARQGMRRQAEMLLSRIASVTSGRTNLIARTNLATLLREDGQIETAMQIYRPLVIGLFRERAYIQLAMVLSEMGVIYRQRGQLWWAIITLEACALLHRFLGNAKSLAIAHSQLASAYRYKRLFLFALMSSRRAVSTFRKSGDLLNLGRSLLTQGNIYQNMRRAEKAQRCFTEALEIGQKTNDPQAICGALGGQARVHLLTKNFGAAQELLQEAISLRERSSDHNIGIEYENMGALFEAQGNLGLALGWYRKALSSFEKYMPIEVARCRYKIQRLESLASKKSADLKK